MFGEQWPDEPCAAGQAHRVSIDKALKGVLHPSGKVPHKYRKVGAGFSRAPVSFCSGIKLLHNYGMLMIKRYLLNHDL